MGGVRWRRRVRRTLVLGRVDGIGQVSTDGIQCIAWPRSAAFSASSRLFDLNGEANSLKKKHSSATIVADIKRSALMSDLNLAVIGNSAIAALVDRRARIVWCCFPRFDGDPIFCSLLEVADDPTGAGLFDIELTNLESSKQEYVRNTAILVTTLTDDAGATVQIADFAPGSSTMGDCSARRSWCAVSPHLPAVRVFAFASDLARIMAPRR